MVKLRELVAGRLCDVGVKLVVDRICDSDVKLVAGKPPELVMYDFAYEYLPVFRNDETLEVHDLVFY